MYTRGGGGVQCVSVGGGWVPVRGGCVTSVWAPVCGHVCVFGPPSSEKPVTPEPLWCAVCQAVHY